jgi:hypothetical protein
MNPKKALETRIRADRRSGLAKIGFSAFEAGKGEKRLY